MKGCSNAAIISNGRHWVFAIWCRVAEEALTFAAEQAISPCTSIFIKHDDTPSGILYEQWSVAPVDRNSLAHADDACLSHDSALRRQTDGQRCIHHI